jgi:nucleolar GTP-binding protein
MARSKSRRRHSGGNFDIPTVPTAQEVLDKAFHRASKVTVEDRDRMHRNRRQAMARVDSIQSTVDHMLQRTREGFAVMEDMHPFHLEVLSTVVDVREVEHALHTLNWCRGQVRDVCVKAVKQLTRTRSHDFVETKRREVYGRVSSLLERVSGELRLLAEAREVLRTLPHIDPAVPTAVVAGSPNVGKSALVARLSSAEPEVASYPFTTKAVTVGHFYHRRHAYQLVDTPGILDRPLEERNPIEMRALAAIEHLDAVLLFLVDPSETCGTSLGEQEALLEGVRARFSGSEVIVVETKSDVERRDVEGRFPVSSITGEGVDELRDHLVEVLPAPEIEWVIREG